MAKEMICCLTCWLVTCGLALPVKAGNADLDLAGWWKFDERQGTTTADASGNGHVGTLHGPIEWTTGWDGSGALRFAGTDNYVRVEDSPKLNPTVGITIVAWLKPGWTGNNRVLQKDPNDGQYRLLKEWDHFVLDLADVGLLQCAVIPPKDEWTHVAATYDGAVMKIYYNAEEVASMPASGKMPTRTSPLIIGSKRPGAPAGDEYNGLIDDVRIYGRGLSPEAVRTLVPRKQKACEPTPPNGAEKVKTALMMWTAGDTAIFHDVYFGTRPNLGRDEYRGRQLWTVYCPGVQPETTYYWRIDEVQEPDVKVHTGDVWVFKTESVTAYGPNPPHHMKWVDPNAVALTWSPGAGAVLHELYFGASQTEVASGTPETFKFKGSRSETSYVIASLARDSTYYWRVDEIDHGGTKHVGELWSFTTLGSGGGIMGEYFSNLDLQGSPALTRPDRELNFNWVHDSPGSGVPSQGFSIRWTGELHVPFADTYTFCTTVKGGVRLWVNHELLVDRWVEHLLILEHEGKIHLEAGVYPIRVEWADMQWQGEDAVVQLYWKSSVIPKQILSAGPLQLLK